MPFLLKGGAGAIGGSLITE